MLLDLPPELLDLIADHLEGDEASLKACCLVSKALKDASQPVLWRHICLVTYSKNVSAFARLAAGRLGRLARSLVIFATYEYLSMNELLAALPHLEAVDVWNVSIKGQGDVSPFEKLHNLRHLHLHLAHLTAFSPFPSSLFIFQSLSSLSLLRVYSPRRVIEDLLSPSVVPALRVLALADLQEGAQPYLPSLPNELLEQLDMLEIGNADLAHLPFTTFDHPTPTLVRLNVSRFHSYLPDLQAARPLHLSVDPLVVQNLNLHHSSSHHFLDPLRTLVRTHSSRLSTLLLPLNLHADYATSGSVPPTLPSLLDEYQRLGVDVRWTDGEEGEDGFHRPFWRYAKKKKRDGQQQEQRIA